MSLPVPKLDDRTFQGLVDEAKARIPQYCPEWTDHNVSDPGVALIELFAWMTELLLYRVNQVPDKTYVKLLDLIGVRLDAPRAAEALITFYLSAPQLTDVAIAAGTEVATVRTETSPATVFTTESLLTVRTAKVLGIFTHGPAADDPFHDQDHDRLQFGGAPFEIFSSEPRAGDSLYIALEKDHSRHVLAVRFACDNAAGPGVNPLDPPLIWEVWQGQDGDWGKCEVEYDATRALNATGDVILHTPHMEPGGLAGQTGYWLRCSLTESAENQGTYYASPLISQLRVEARGGTVGARHAVTTHNEILGRSDGTPGQAFKLKNTPLLSRDKSRDLLIVEVPGVGDEKWEEKDDFADSKETDRHYTLDRLTGELTLGPTLLQPTGKVYSFGAIPPKGAALRMARYQHGGGSEGNLPAGAIRVMKSSIPYVAHVVNRTAASGGQDPESLDSAKLKAPQELRSRTRAVTAEDYEAIAVRTPGVARAHCLTPGEQPAQGHDPPPGHVVVLVVPGVTDKLQFQPQQLQLNTELLQSVHGRLDAHRLLGTTVEVRTPRLIWVTVAATLRVAARTDPAAREEARLKGEEILYRYLNPFTGGPNGDGWPLGRDLNRSELLGLLQQIPVVEYADGLRVTVAESHAAAVPVSAAQHLAVPYDALVCSGQHQLRVEFARDLN